MQIQRILGTNSKSDFGSLSTKKNIDLTRNALISVLDRGDCTNLGKATQMLLDGKVSFFPHSSIGSEYKQVLSYVANFLRLKFNPLGKEFFNPEVVATGTIGKKGSIWAICKDSTIVEVNKSKNTAMINSPNPFVEGAVYYPPSEKPDIRGVYPQAVLNYNKLAAGEKVYIPDNILDLSSEIKMHPLTFCKDGTRFKVIPKRPVAKAVVDAAKEFLAKLGK